MKETLYTIPLTDAFLANDECPFCYVSRNIEQDLLDLVLGSGSSYMESDMRDKTDKVGFCRMADSSLSEAQKDEFFPFIFQIMKDNLGRVSEDVSWMVEKFDYRNKDADWKNSKDAIQRGIQKLKGGYPADASYKQS